MAKSDFETELGRVIHRLEVLPLRYQEVAYELTHSAAQTLRDLTLEIDPTGPRELPVLAPRMASAQLSVIAQDFLAECDEQQIDRATSLLTDLRRSLP